MDAVLEGWEQTLFFVLNVIMVPQTMLRSEKSPVLQNFVCPRCAREGRGGDDCEEDEGTGLVVNGAMLAEVEQFCYLGDVLDCVARVERAVRARVTAAWRWRKIGSLLVNRNED